MKFIIKVRRNGQDLYYAQNDRRGLVGDKDAATRFDSKNAVDTRALLLGLVSFEKSIAAADDATLRAGIAEFSDPTTNYAREVLALMTAAYEKRVAGWWPKFIAEIELLGGRVKNKAALVHDESEVELEVPDDKIDAVREIMRRYWDPSADAVKP